MTYRGRVKNGVIVLEPPASLPEGAEVEVHAGGRRRSNPNLCERYKAFIGIADGLPPDMADNHDHYIHGAPRRS